jgi:hypothetical protein
MPYEFLEQTLIRDHDSTAQWWLSVPELCQLLSIAPTEWERWRQAGRAPHHQPGPDGRLHVHRADLQAWLDHLHASSPNAFLSPVEAEACIRQHLSGERTLGDPPPRMEPAAEWLTVPEICAELGVTPDEWQQWRVDGTAPPHHVTGGTARVHRVTFEAWLDSLPRVPLWDDPS